MQVVMVVIIAAWVAIASGILFAIIKATIGLRVSAEEEAQGLDVLEHGLQGYAGDSTSVGV
jgi:Amt family ammonium transporter